MPTDPDCVTLDVGPLGKLVIAVVVDVRSQTTRVSRWWLRVTDDEGCIILESPQSLLCKGPVAEAQAREAIDGLKSRYETEERG